MIQRRPGECVGLPGYCALTLASHPHWNAPIPLPLVLLDSCYHRFDHPGRPSAKTFAQCLIRNSQLVCDCYRRCRPRDIEVARSVGHLEGFLLGVRHSVCMTHHATV